MRTTFLLILLTVTMARADWEQWSPRPEITPRFEKEGLKIKTSAYSEFGAWQQKFAVDKPGDSYRFSAWYAARHVKNERRSVIARVEWQDAKGRQVRPPEYAIDVETKGGRKRVELKSFAPTNSAFAVVQLSLGFAEKAEVAWDSVEFTPAEAPASRIVRAVTIYCRPRGEKGIEEFYKLVEKSGKYRPDIICLPEGITVVGTGKSYAEVSEALDGPTATRLGALAKSLKSYIVAGIYERSGGVVYNTAILLDREGRLAGSYRKTHLPREEWEAGITPGDEYPVFQTDFGKIGLTICWDVQFPEPARAMALKGAEIILLPIWGGNEVLARARAIENHVFMITSSYDMNTFIVDPAGKVLAEASKTEPIAFAEIQLDQKIYQPWLGDMKNRTWKERRPDIALE